MGRGSALALLIAAIVCALVPLAYASPPDPTYLSGVWDDADYDDVVVLVTSSVGSTDTHKPFELVRLLVGVLLILPAEDELHCAASRFLPAPRAPPTI